MRGLTPTFLKMECSSTIGAESRTDRGVGKRARRSAAIRRTRSGKPGGEGRIETPRKRMAREWRPAFRQEGDTLKSSILE